MRFYGLHEGYYEGVDFRLEQIKLACNTLGVEFIPIDSLNADYTNLPVLGKDDMLYNIARGSEMLEMLLLNDAVTTFYIKNPSTIEFKSDTTKFSVLHDRAGLPAPKTIYHLTKDRGLLKRYVDYLGGFPIVLKVAGGTLGIGTIKVESWHSLNSTVDYLVSRDEKFIMREFIDATHGARIIVLGNNVITSGKFFFQENDFRNAPILSATRYGVFTASIEMKDLCVKAAHIANTEWAGVDLLFDKNGNYYLLEVNTPLGFQLFKDNPQPILEKMVDYLIKKAKTNGTEEV